MISPSRRRRPDPPIDTDFQAHLRLARRKGLHRRLIRASLLALIVAAALLFAPATSAWHAVATAVAFVVGALLPTREREADALSEIRAHAGFSYDTALELITRSEGEESNDPYGFAAAVEQRARINMRGFQPKQQAPWWLPATLVALTLVLLPNLLPAGGLFGAGGGPGGAEPGSAAPGFEELDENRDDNAETQPDAPGRANDEAGSSADDNLADAADVPPPPEEGAGEAPLTRYLESLRERSASSGGAETQGSAQQVQDSPAESEANNDNAAGAESTAGQAREAASSDEASPQDAEGDGAPDGSRATTPRAQEDEGVASDQDGTDEGFEGAAASELQDAQRNDEERLSEEDGAGPGDAGERSDSGRDEAEELSSGASADMPGSGDGPDNAGSGGSEESGEPTTIELPAGSPELLSGVLGEGPETPAGAVRLPGSDEVQLPSGTSAAPYRSAAEEALTEGDLPLEYQEIIRRYFQ